MRFALLVKRGFDQTTMGDIAAELGIGRRTLFRYYPSKNDLVWGEFDEVLDRLRVELHSGDWDRSIIKAVRQAAMSSDTYHAEGLDELHARLSLIPAAFSCWVAHRDEDILALIGESYGLLVDGFAIDPPTASLEPRHRISNLVVTSLARLSWTTAEQRSGSVLVVPVGATEQH